MNNKDRRDLLRSALYLLEKEKVAPTPMIVEHNNKAYAPIMRRTCGDCNHPYLMGKGATNASRHLSMGITSCPLCGEKPRLYRFINVNSN